jgi:hypothetical protein
LLVEPRRRLRFHDLQLSDRAMRVARLIGPAAVAKQLGIARSSVYRMLGDAA